jgi:hypothetical protein
VKTLSGAAAPARGAAHEQAADRARAKGEVVEGRGRASTELRAPKGGCPLPPWQRTGQPTLVEDRASLGGTKCVFRKENVCANAAHTIPAGGDHQAFLVAWDRREQAQRVAALPCREPSVKDDEVPRDHLQLLREELEVIAPLGKEQRRAALLERGGDVVQVQAVSGLIGGHRGIEVLDGAPWRPLGGEGRLPDHESVSHSASSRSNELAVVFGTSQECFSYRCSWSGGARLPSFGDAG